MGIWVAGVDGCSVGWVVVLHDLTLKRHVARVEPNFAAVLALPEAPTVAQSFYLSALPRNAIALRNPFIGAEPVHRCGIRSSMRDSASRPREEIPFAVIRDAPRSQRSSEMSRYPPERPKAPNGRRGDGGGGGPDLGFYSARAGASL